MSKKPEVYIRNTSPADFEGIIEMCEEVYPSTPSWGEEQLRSHLEVFPEGQWVAVEAQSEKVMGMGASLIVQWDEYDRQDNWRDFTEHGMFTNHDPDNGRTLYGAEMMVRPLSQGRGIGKKLYNVRRALVEKLGVLRIRAGARLRGYHSYADEIDVKEYVHKVVNRELYDPTLSFQLRRGFRVLDVVSDYLHNDPESRGHAALIEWINHRVARPEDIKDQPEMYRSPEERLVDR